MRIAILVQCHKNPEQINKMLCAMQHPAITFFIHVDKKATIEKDLLSGENIIQLPDAQRIDVQWSKISQIDATLNLLEYARKNGEYDFFWLCSGQDFPIKSANQIVCWFEKHNENDFIELFPSRNTGLDYENNYDKRNAIYFPEWMLGREHWQRIIKRLYIEMTGGYNRTFRFARRKPVDNMRFYYGSSWVCLTRRTLNWITDYLNFHPDYYSFFKNCNCPDESFFQTLVMNSPYSNLRMDYLHFVEWIAGQHNPKLLTIEDYQKLKESDKLMARKFDMKVDKSIIEKLELWGTDEKD